MIGAGMAGRAHAAGYRTASPLYEAGLHNLRVLSAVTASAARAGVEIVVE